MKRYSLYLAGKATESSTTLAVRNKYSGEVFAEVGVATDEVIDAAIEAAVRASDEMRKMAPYHRQSVLQHCVSRFRERFEELAELLCLEAGKPIKDARGEVTRLIDTFRVAAEESVRIHGELLELQISERAHGRRGMVKRVPIGPCSFISPFNFPLNLVAHKVAPAIAAGCPFVLKPASRTPIGALVIGEVLAETDLPSGAFSILPCGRSDAARFVEDERIKYLSFTGSSAVGWDLKARAGKKKVSLELGGNAACIVDRCADLDDAVERIVIGAFYQSGQSCVGVQRIIVHQEIYEELKARLVTRTKALVAGDPRDPATFVGPMISEKEAVRVERWVQAAIERGASVLCGGSRDGAVYGATLLENVPKDCELVAEEVFGPVAVLSPFEDFGDAIAETNDSEFGLQAGVFTQNLGHAMRAWDELEVGGVLVGDIPSWRVDHMPYGGVKDSGLGREGVRYAIEEMTEPRLLVLRV